MVDGATRSRLMIFLTVCNLAEEKPFKQISVNDVCEACDISRATFYRNFSGMSEIPLWWESYVAGMTGNNIGKSLTIKEGHSLTMRFLKKGRPLISDASRWWSGEVSLVSVNNELESLKRNLQDRGVVLTKRLMMELRGMVFSNHAISMEWFANGCDMSPDEVAEIMWEGTPSELRELLDSPSDRNEMLEALVLADLVDKYEAEIKDKVQR